MGAPTGTDDEVARGWCWLRAGRAPNKRPRRQTQYCSYLTSLSELPVRLFLLVTSAARTSSMASLLRKYSAETRSCDELTGSPHGPCTIDSTRAVVSLTNVFLCTCHLAE
jgi:hypothetical protein